MPQGEYQLDAQFPAIEDYLHLRKAAGLTPFSREAAERGLKGTFFGVRIRIGEDIVGMGRIIGDGGCFFQITDIAVLPDHQGKGLGKAIMAALVAHLQDTVPATAYVSLIADVPANRLYAQFGFRETAPRSVGMSMVIAK
ncbi:GNAT family N-acetyltransferase [Rhizobium sp. SSA_523]|uniref:GNAT family N-acetyltransferase n=1 Tax=Rhizobium sp. SSA_523 TaxID=2952477 RepID=UPI002090DAF9|nr:GNAT family N-acetyltransferase [Rhizobium sp. SSA_523]MCO5731070.1 GNAT family N-acetyltransferase [Rhizobium sp. SSA_523]WKC24129.1 GNAT family N-acetyltransferase [Rhizobium sp. SSA_523]